MNPIARHVAAICLLVLASTPNIVEAQVDPCGMEHRVEARVEGDLAHLTVYRTFHNASPRYIEMFDGLELPRNGTVHGFALESQGQWTEGTLLAASEAERRYEALRGKGRAAPRTIAKLSASQDAAELYIWNLPPRASVTVRYDVRVRLSYEHGRLSFTYPLPDPEHHSVPECSEPASRPVLTVAPPYPGTEVLIEKAQSTSFREVLEVSWEVKPFSGLDARAGLVPWGTGSLGFLQVRAGRLSEPPSKARVVFVLDASHSVGPEGIAQQLELAGRYLQLLPDASTEVVVFRRSAERLFGRFIPASEWKARLDALPAARLAPGNGSHLDEGLRLAQRVLTEGTGPTRVLALTDGLLRRAFEPIPPAPTTSAPDAAVHLLSLRNRVGRAAEHEKLSGPLVRESCGIHLPYYSQKDLEPVVRPVRLEEVRLEDEQGTRLGEWATLDEGEGLRRWLPSPQHPVSGLALRGLRWSCPSSTPVEIDPTLSADLGRHAHAWSVTPSMARSGDDAPPPPEAVKLLAKTGDWLSPDRSFLAVPRGAGPSSSRTRPLSGRLGGVIGGVIGDTISCPAAPPLGRENDPKFSEELTKLLRPAFAVCLKGTATPAIAVRVETTGDEIVDVDVTGAASEAQATCVREATWKLRLPALFDDGLAASYTLTPGP